MAMLNHMALKHVFPNADFLHIGENLAPSPTEPPTTTTPSSIDKSENRSMIIRLPCLGCNIYFVISF